MPGKSSWTAPSPRRNFGRETGAAMVGGLCALVALYALYRLEETFHKYLNCFEQTL